jgi:hypothetical protein
MRLGVPFIAPRQLGAVENKSGRPSLPSVVGLTGHVRCTLDSPVPPSDRWLGHVSRADRAADRWLTGQSGAPDRNSLLAVHSRLRYFLLLSVSNT